MKELIEKNEKEYGELCRRLRFPDKEQAMEFRLERLSLLENLSGKVSLSCKGSKLHSGPLSPGCQACVSGQWSCLFINNLCNGRCFFCPSPQVKKSQPGTNNLDFNQVGDYLAYLDRFRFSGASISGGEPLITPERTFDFVGRIKKQFGQGIYLWLYTNGILANEENLKKLADLGLNEIRFDLSAREYQLDKIELAVRCIPNVTVEIPAIPEDYERLKSLLPTLAGMGVKYLNLHQLRLTTFNAEKLLQRNYTYSHGVKITVIESELTALRLLGDTLESSGPSVNYCSFAYKDRYQGAAARRRAAVLMAKPFETVTESGYVRSLFVKAPVEQLQALVENFRQTGSDEHSWKLEKEGKLYFSPDLIPTVARSISDGILAQYSLCSLQEKNTYQGSYQEIPLNKRRKIIAQRRTILSGRPYTVHSGQQFPADSEDSVVSMNYEDLPQGLPDYF